MGLSPFLPPHEVTPIFNPKPASFHPKTPSVEPQPLAHPLICPQIPGFAPKTTGNPQTAIFHPNPPPAGLGFLNTAVVGGVGELAILVLLVTPSPLRVVLVRLPLPHFTLPPPPPAHFWVISSCFLPIYLTLHQTARFWGEFLCVLVLGTRKMFNFGGEITIKFVKETQNREIKAWRHSQDGGSRLKMAPPPPPPNAPPMGRWVGSPFSRWRPRPSQDGVATRSKWRLGPALSLPVSAFE